MSQSGLIINGKTGQAYCFYCSRGTLISREEGNGRQRKAAEGSGSIARNCGHFAPVINCQLHLILKMAQKSQRSGGRVSYDVLNNLSSVDLIYDDKRKKKTSQESQTFFVW